jgi:hypothetical protein
MKIAKFGLLVVIAILGFALLGSSPASAYIYPSAGDSLIASPGTGREINVNIVGKGGDLDFITFCLETNEFISFGSTFIVGAITDAAVAGGSGGPGGGSDPLDPRTAYLYTMFTNGTLPDFTGSVQDANDLQAAIWFIEQEVAPYGVTNHFVDQANAAIALGGAWFGLGLGDVNAINLTTVAGGPAQDLLTRTPVPEPSMMLLFGSGMLGLAFVARKRFFKK